MLCGDTCRLLIRRETFRNAFRLVTLSEDEDAVDVASQQLDRGAVAEVHITVTINEYSFILSVFIVYSPGKFYLGVVRTRFKLNTENCHDAWYGYY